MEIKTSHTCPIWTHLVFQPPINLMAMIYLKYCISIHPSIHPKDIRIFNQEPKILWIADNRLFVTHKFWIYSLRYKQCIFCVEKVQTFSFIILIIQEYLYQLVCIDDTYRLTECLCDWRVFDKLYHEEYSSKLLEYWRKVWMLYLQYHVHFLMTILNRIC